MIIEYLQRARGPEFALVIDEVLMAEDKTADAMACREKGGGEVGSLRR